MKKIVYILVALFMTLFVACTQGGKCGNLERGQPGELFLEVTVIGSFHACGNYGSRVL